MTSEEVRARVGTPEEVHRSPFGKILEMYSEQDVIDQGSVLTAGKLELRSLHVLYDAEGRVEKVIFHEDISPMASGRGWRAGRFISDEEVERIVKDATTREELYEYFGPPTVRGINVDGHDYLSWQFLEGRGAMGVRRTLHVILDENSIVRAFQLRDSSSESRW